MKEGNHIRASIKPIRPGDEVHLYTETGKPEGEGCILRYNPYDDSFLVHVKGEPKGEAKIKKLHEIKPKEG